MKNHNKNHNKDINNDKSHELSKISIDSIYFKSKLNLNEILGFYDSSDDIAIFIDEKVLPEINGDELNYKKYLEIVEAINCLVFYGKYNKLKTNELKSFILILIDLLYNNYNYRYNLNKNIVSLTNNEIKTRNRAIEFLNTLDELEMDETQKIKLLIDFVLNNYEKEKELIKKSVMISPDHIEKINQIEGKGFSAKVRFILDGYFAQNKTIVTEEEIISEVDSKLIEIYKKIKKEILSWNKQIKFKPLKDYLIFSYYYRFLKLSFDKDKINLELSFGEEKPFEDYKDIINDIVVENKIKKINFSVNSYKDINHALFLIKQSYENNNQDIYSYSAYNHSIHKLFNDTKRYDFPFGNKIPKNGLFALFEKGEKFQDNDRIVYVGSNIKENRMPKMLNFIFKDGNRDNTSFRKNIGRSILAKDDSKYMKKFEIISSLGILNDWNMDLKEFNEEYSDESEENKEMENVEEMVSQYIQDNFSFSIIEINDKLKRLNLKNKIISSLSLSDEFNPSDEWLGSFSPREKIRKNGLWLEQHLGNRENQLTEEDVEFLKEMAND